MTKGQLLVRTFAWAAAGFLLTSGALTAFANTVGTSDYGTGVKALVIAGVSAALAGVIAVLQSWKWRADTALGRAESQFGQMMVAGLGTLGLADLTGAAAVAFGQATVKLVVASLIGSVTAYYVNR